MESIYSYRDGELVQIDGGFFIYYYCAYPTPDGRPGINLINDIRHPDIADAIFYKRLIIENDSLVTHIELTHAFEEWFRRRGDEEVTKKPDGLSMTIRCLKASLQAHTIYILKAGAMR